ncbi:unnamed protein product [Rhodiola kirilowii]
MGRWDRRTWLATSVHDHILLVVLIQNCCALACLAFFFRYSIQFKVFLCFLLLIRIITTLSSPLSIFSNASILSASLNLIINSQSSVPLGLLSFN